MKKITFSEKDTKKIIELYLTEKLNLIVIGEKFNVSKATIKKILIDFLVIQHLYTAREIIDMCHYILYDRAKNRANSESGKPLTYNHD